MPLIVIETSSTKVAVVQSSLQEISSINLVPCVFYLAKKQYLNIFLNYILQNMTNYAALGMMQSSP